MTADAHKCVCVYVTPGHVTREFLSRYIFNVRLKLIETLYVCEISFIESFWN